VLLELAGGGIDLDGLLVLLEDGEDAVEAFVVVGAGSLS
jgi:hypothetical protein